MQGRNSDQNLEGLLAHAGEVGTTQLDVVQLVKTQQIVKVEDLIVGGEDVVGCAHMTDVLVALLLAGLAIKKPTQKNPPKNPLKMFFLGFINFLIFYENNTNFSL
jgi:hypothetical protein